MVDKYLKLLRDMRDAWKAGEWKKVYALIVEVAIVVRDMLGAGIVVAMSVAQMEEVAALQAEIKGLAESTALPADAEATKDGKLAAWLVKFFLELIGHPLPFASE